MIDLIETEIDNSIMEKHTPKTNLSTSKLTVDYNYSDEEKTEENFLKEFNKLKKKFDVKVYYNINDGEYFIKNKNFDLPVSNL
jgi:hypothetical protein